LNANKFKFIRYVSGINWDFFWEPGNSWEFGTGTGIRPKNLEIWDWDWDWDLVPGPNPRKNWVLRYACAYIFLNKNFFRHDYKIMASNSFNEISLISMITLKKIDIPDDEFKYGTCLFVYNFK
jgi:hypothetical protein